MCLTKAERPFGVTVLCLLFSVMGILDGVRFFFPQPFSRMLVSAMRLDVIGIVLLIFVVIDFALAYGLWKAERWAWVGAIGFAAFRIIIAVVSLFLRPGGGPLISLVLCLLVLYYLMQPRVQTFFRRPSPNTMGPVV